MSEYTICEIKKNDKRENKLMDILLEKEGILRDGNLDYSIGMFDEDYNLVATGSCFKNTLRCMAVDSEHQGEGLLNQIVSKLIEYQYSINNYDLFLYTKINSAKFFGDLGFYEIARVDDKLVFMENRKDGFSGFLSKLALKSHNGNIGAIVMNANPFTYGHLYLVEEAARSCDCLYVFVVSEDASLVPFDVRFKLVKEGTAHLSNVEVLPSSDYIISNATFPSYFLKDEDLVINTHAKLDIEIFGKICKAMNIKTRFVGEEPFSRVTAIYNDIMAKELPMQGVEVKIIKRKALTDGEIISASLARKALKENDFEKFKTLVPATTYDFFSSNDGVDIINKIKQI